MKAPKCRLCGAAHWTHEAHQWSKEPVTNKSPAVTNSPNVTNTVTNKPQPVTNSVTNTDTERQRKWREANRDKYNTRQRDYMRQRRAKAN